MTSVLFIGDDTDIHFLFELLFQQCGVEGTMITTADAYRIHYQAPAWAAVLIDAWSLPASDRRVIELASMYANRRVILITSQNTLDVDATTAPIESLRIPFTVQELNRLLSRDQGL